MIRTKPGVKLYGSKPEMADVNAIVAQVFEQHGYDCTITCAIGKRHKHRSLHPVGFARDYKSKHLPDLRTKRSILFALQVRLPYCDIILEHIDKDQEHYHVEFDDHDDPVFQKHKKHYIETGGWDG